MEFASTQNPAIRKHCEKERMRSLRAILGKNLMVRYLVWPGNNVEDIIGVLNQSPENLKGGRSLPVYMFTARRYNTLLIKGVYYTREILFNMQSL